MTEAFQKKAIITTKVIASIASVLGVIVVIVTLYTLQYEIPKPENWSADVKVYKRSVGGETSVFDSESGKLLFTYRPEYDLKRSSDKDRET
jgi:hypothetical protein